MITEILKEKMVAVFGNVLYKFKKMTLQEKEDYYKLSDEEKAIFVRKWCREKISKKKKWKF